MSKINASKAWDVTIGSGTIKIGLIGQSGVKRDHPDLSSKFTSEGDLDYNPNDNHETLVAGVAGAATNNSLGIASLGWQPKLVAYRYTPGTDGGTLPAQIDSAIADTCRVINCSFSTARTFLMPDCKTGTKDCYVVEPQNYSSVATAIANAINQGVVVVASAGNESLNLGKDHFVGCDTACDIFPYVSYPAAYPSVIAVSATDVNDVFAGGLNWNYGSFIDVAAPGINILTTDINNGYSTVSGTSHSSPLVAALAGLIKSLNVQLSSGDVENIVRNTVVDLGTSGQDNYYGYGRIDAYQALLLTHAYSNKSMSTTATAYNNGRRLVKDNDGKYHLVFESGITSGGNVLSEIFYRRSNVGGTSWDPPVRLSAGDEQNRYPCITERNGILYVVWQRKNGSTHDILYRSYASGVWSSIQTLASGVGGNNPLPAMISSSLSSDLMLVYRTSSALQYRRYTGGSWQSPASVTGTTSASRNPSLSYNEDYGFVLTWDNGSNVYHQYFSTSWSSPVRVSSASLPAFDHQYSSNAASENMDRHIAWQAFEADVYQRQVIYYNRNLNSTNFTMFVSENDDYLRPTITGHTSSAASVVWHDASSNNNIRKAYYNGTSWVDGQTGTVIASNGADASLSITNPYGGTAKAVWRSVGTAPYTLTLGPSGGLGKNAANEIFVYHRRILYSLDTTAVLALQMSTPQIISKGSSAISFPAVSDKDSLVAAQLA